MTELPPRITLANWEGPTIVVILPVNEIDLSAYRADHTEWRALECGVGHRLSEMYNYPYLYWGNVGVNQARVRYSEIIERILSDSYSYLKTALDATTLKVADIKLESTSDSPSIIDTRLLDGGAILVIFSP